MIIRRNAMLVYQDMIIRIDDSTVEQMIAKFDALLPSSWRRDKSREVELHEKFVGHKQYAYSTEYHQTLPCARLWLAMNENGDLYISNIVPNKMRKLTIEQYNSILQSFSEIIKRDPSIQCTVTKANVTLDDFMPQDVAQKLIRFSNAANRSTGIGHPCDHERWLDFVVTFYRKKCQRRMDWILRWLNEEEKWTEDGADDLCTYLEHALEVLDYYNKA
jgi:hypothetical protein